MTAGCSKATHEIGSDTPGAMDGARAQILFKARRFRELVGVEFGATPVEIKAMCKRALLLYHPDKGGNEEVFKWIRPATEILLLDENLCTFDYGVPSWARIQLGHLAELRQDITASITRLESARSKLETTRSDTTRARAQNDALMAERGLNNLRTILAEELDWFRGCYVEHERVERAHRDEAATREAKAAADFAVLKRHYTGVVVVMRHRHQRAGKRFPTMPRAIIDVNARAALGVLKVAYRKVTKTTNQRTQRGGVTDDLEPEAAELLAKAHALVDRSCHTVHCNMAISRERFPVLPTSDPRALALRELCREHRRLTKCLKGNMPDEQSRDIYARTERLRDQAVILLEPTRPVVVKTKVNY